MEASHWQAVVCNVNSPGLLVRGGQASVQRVHKQHCGSFPELCEFVGAHKLATFQVCSLCMLRMYHEAEGQILRMLLASARPARPHIKSVDICDIQMVIMSFINLCSCCLDPQGKGD